MGNRKRTREWWANYRATRRTPTPHGTQQGYANWSCRCTSCTEAHRQHVADWRANR